MKNDAQVQEDVMAELRWEPSLKAAEIGVSAKDGVVTLTGIVDCYAKKLLAEEAVKRVAGVSAVVEKIEVQHSREWNNRDDSDIAAAVVRALKWSWAIPSDKVKARVEKGWITLEGELTWKFQSEAAAAAVRSLEGVVGVSNQIKIGSQMDTEVEKADIERAWRRNGALSSQDIQVRVSGNKAILTGSVTSWYQKDEAERIAWNAPGIWHVDNNVRVNLD